MANNIGEYQVVWDAALLIRLRDGDGAAFDSLVRSYAGVLITHAAYIVNSVDTAQDIVQEVFFSLWQHRSKIEPTWDITSYLYGLTRRRAIDSARSRESASQRETRWTIQQDLENEASIFAWDLPEDGNEVRIEVWNALSGVSARCREVFMLVWDRQMTYREIALHFGLTEQTVRIYASRAMKKLADVLGPKYR